MAGDFIRGAKENLEKGLDWGKGFAQDTYEGTKDAAVAGYNMARDGAVAGYNMAVDGAVAGYTFVRDSAIAGYTATRDGVVRGFTLVRNGAVVGYTTVRDGVVTVYQNGKEVAKGAIGDASVQAAIKGAQWATNDKAREDALVNAVDRRDLYTAKDVCVQCEAAKEGHPNTNDGKFLGANCTPSTTVPAVGKLPEGCGPGCKLPRIYFTNGINNTEEQVCETLQKLADIKCAEVVGIYNATFADAKKVTPPKPATRPPTQDKDRPFYRIDQKIGDAIDDKVASAKFAAADAAGRTGLLQDILDCIDNIDAAGLEKAAHTQSSLLQNALSADPPTPVTLYAHSQGGLITQEGLNQARTGLYSDRYSQLMKGGMDHFSAKTAASAYADQRMKNVNVTSFGTAENNWLPGPGYAHYTNTRDPVPALIKQVQSSRGVDTSKTGGKVNSFTASPSFDPMSAHGMKESYLPQLEKTASSPRTNGKCCP